MTQDAQTARIPFHPYANLFPMMTAAERAELVRSIGRDGQRHPVVIDEDGIIDGRNRYEACLALGLTPRTRAYDPRPRPQGDGPDRLAFVLAENLERRHLNESQRAMVAARLATMRQGERTDLAVASIPDQGDGSGDDSREPSANLPKVDQVTAAKMLSVSDRSVRDAKVVQTKAEPEIQRAVDAGQLAVSAAKQAAALAPDVQRRIAGEAAAGKANVVRTAIKQGTRAVREEKLGGQIADLPEEKFGLFDMDPEWRFDVWSRETGLDRSADNHYPTSPDDVIGARRAMIDRFAADHCIVRLWVTDLARGIDTLRQLGFVYKSYWTWVKTHRPVELDLRARQALAAALGWPLDDVRPRILMPVKAPGNGYWNRDEDELCLLGTRGSPVCPAMGEQGGSVWYEPRREHSVKPEIAYAWADKHFAHTPRLEMNARRRRLGWQAWGNEVTPGDPAIIALEREALSRGLIDGNGMVRTSATSVVGFDHVTAEEWRAVLAAAELKNLTSVTIAADDIDRADLDRALADPANIAAMRVTPFSESKVVATSTSGAVSVDDQLDIPAFLRRQA